MPGQLLLEEREPFGHVLTSWRRFEVAAEAAVTIALAGRPFEQVIAPKPSIFARLFRRELRERASAEMETLLASRSPDAIRPDEISAIAAACRLSPATFLAFRCALYAKAYQCFLADDRIDDGELAYLGALRRALQIGDEDWGRLVEKYAVPRYRRAVNEAVASDPPAADFRERVEQLADALRLPMTMRQAAYATCVKPVLDAKLHAALADRRFSPAELVAFDRLSTQLGITPTFTPDTEFSMRRFALFWRIEAGDLPDVDAPIQLVAGERCHFAASAQWLEHRQSTRTVGYASQGVSIRIARGVYYRVGRSTPQRVTVDELKPIESGSFYLTSKRVIFQGGERNFAIKTGSLLSFHGYLDAIVLEKTSGKNPHIMMTPGDTELAGVILATLLHGPTE